MIPAAFDYIAPQSLDEAVRALAAARRRSQASGRRT